MRVIWSHELDTTHNDTQSFGMPRNAVIVGVEVVEYDRFGMQEPTPRLKFYFEADTDAEPVQRHFKVIKTGEALPVDYRVHRGIGNLREHLYHVLEVYGVDYEVPYTAMDL